MSKANIPKYLNTDHVIVFNEDAEQHGTQENTCNCCQKTTAHLKENAKQRRSIVYQANVTNEDDNAQETKVGLTEGTFKTR